jgi:hypothetical protein
MALLRGVGRVRAVRYEVGIRMYVKWRSEQLRDKSKSVVLRAQIVRSYRDPARPRKVRSEFIAYLASIKEADRNTPLMQEMFYREVDHKLARLSLNPDDEQRIREKLLETVPRPRSWREILAPYAKFAHRRAGIR